MFAVRQRNVGTRWGRLLGRGLPFVAALWMLTDTPRGHACDVPPSLVARASEKAGAKQIGKTPLGAAVLVHPAVGELHVECDLNGLSAHIMLETASPSQTAFDVTATVASVVLDAPKKDVLAAVRSCHGQALKSKDEWATVDTKGLHLECQAFRRDGGGTAMGIWKQGGSDTSVGKSAP